MLPRRTLYYYLNENFVSEDTTAFCELYLKPLLYIGQYIILLIDIMPTVAFDYILIMIISYGSKLPAMQCTKC